MGVVLTLGASSYAQITAPPCATPTPPIIGGTPSICRGESAILSATGCSGNVIWNTGQTGNHINVQPQLTTRYTALCRTAEGCLSCFAEVWKVTVNTPTPPIVAAAESPVCSGDMVTLTASGCAGTLTWPDGSTGRSIAVRAVQTMTFAGVVCTEKNCPSSPSVPIEVAVGQPTKPVLSVTQSIICAGQTITLMAGNCLGVVRWFDGQVGINRVFTPTQSRSFRALCQMGSCQSDSSDALPITVNAGNLRPVLTSTTFTNGCPYQTADLTQAVPADKTRNPAGVWLFRTRADPASPALQSPMAVETGDYYLFLQTADGCYSKPITLSAQIAPCTNAIAPCMSNPARVVVWADSLNGSRGSVVLQAQLRGSATSSQWTSTGTGLLTSDKSVSTRYLFSETDRQRGAIVFALTTPDPDGNGPCAGALASLTVAVPLANSQTGTEVVGLGKMVFEPTWLPNREVELVYQLTIANMGKNPLANVQVVDDLDRAFAGSGARVQSVTVRADNGWATNPAYSGQGADTTMLLAGASLPTGAKQVVRLTVRLNIGQANTLTFDNQAHVNALDVNGTICRDVSTSGNDPDPDKNGNPGDNNEPTVLTLHSVAAEGDVFIPEGFSPNGDGINDNFIVSRVPAGTTMQLRVFNRWGNPVFEREKYQNDWNGTANVGVVSGVNGQGLPEGTYFYVLTLSDGREYSRFMTLNR
ncbi:MAG: gliding motility-associated C-terminal domain-containing protein [Rudanella sp.]|nr:gliding motility-associated C-terminal domain-containing protein [Rudanella sp.]